MATSPWAGGVHVAIPMCHSTPDRERLHAWVADRWRQFLPAGWTFCYATDRHRESMEEPPRTTDTFNHPKAINRAVRSGPDPKDDDVLVICDADTFPSLVDFGERIQAAREGRWSAPERYVQLKPDVTEKVLKEPSFVHALDVANSTHGYVWQGGASWAGVVVIRRDQFEEVGGYDERYDAWWADDVAFAMSVETLVAPVTRMGTVFHLYHDAPRDQTYERPGFSETWVTTTRYLKARGDERAIRALIAERP